MGSVDSNDPVGGAAAGPDVEADGAPASGGPVSRPRWGLLAGVGAGVLALDQVTKWWAVDALGDGHAVDLVGSLRLKLAFNTGSAFSLAQGRGALISLLALAVVAVLVRTGRHATRPLAALALGLVVGGALGNLADRAFRDGPGDEGFLGGAVVDFVDLQWWPVFNVADSAIVCGAFLLVASSWREERPDDEPDADRARRTDPIDGGRAGDDDPEPTAADRAGAGDDLGREATPSRADGAV